MVFGKQKKGAAKCEAFHISHCKIDEVSWCIFLLLSYRLDRDVYGPICGQDWSQDWSEEVCAGMNFLGVETSWNSSLVASEYFLLNGSLTVDDVSHVQEARSNYIQPCGTDAISFQCQSYSKKAAFYLSLYYSAFVTVGSNVPLLYSVHTEYVFFCPSFFATLNVAFLAFILFIRKQLCLLFFAYFAIWSSNSSSSSFF